MPHLRWNLTIESNTPTKTAGASVAHWATFASVCGDIAPIKSREFWAARGVMGEVSHEWVIRYVSGVTKDMRIKYGTRVFEISGPPINGIVGAPGTHERNQWLTIPCVERT